MSERDKFIADMIFELSKQKETDETFNKPRNLTEKEVFQKMCFSFPVVSSDDLEKLELYINKTLRYAKTSLDDGFCLDDAFLENVVNISEKHERGHPSAPQSIAALVFLNYPDYLLRCNKRKLSVLFSNNVRATSNYEWDVPNKKKGDMDWISIIEAFRSLVMKSSSSLVCNLPLKAFVDSSCLVGLRSTISTLDQLVRLLSASDNTSAKSSDNSSKTDTEIESDFLSELDDDSNDHSLTLEEVFRRVVKEVLTVSNAHTVTTQGSIVSMCKEMWLHCIFLYRDVLIRTPVLINSYLSPLCDVLLVSAENSSSATQRTANANTMTDLFSFKPKVAEARPYPSSSECMFVVTVGNIATFLTAPPTSSSSPAVAVADVQQLASSREAMRNMLTSKGRLTSLVDICERMSSGHTPLKSARSTEVVPLDVESTTFLLDVCTLYSSDLRNGSYTYSVSASGSSSSSGGAGSVPLSAAKHFEALVTSRALGVLVEALVGCVRSAVRDIDAALIASTITKTDGETSIATSGRADRHNLAALASRLIKFFSFSALHSPAVCSYLLTSTDFPPALITLNNSWSNFMTVLRTEGRSGISGKVLEDTLEVFAPSEAVALFSVILLVQTSTASSDLQVCELIFSLLQLAVQIVGDFQLPLALSSSVQAVTIREDYVVANTNSSKEVSGVATTSDVVLEEDSYTPEEVAEKLSSEASGLARHRFVTRTAQRLAKSVELLVSESDAAGQVKTLFRSNSNTGAKGSLVDRLQQLIRSTVVRDMLRLTAAQLAAITSVEEESLKAHQQAESSVVVVKTDSVNDTVADPAPTTSSTPPVVNVTAIRGAHEALKKQLKALQSLTEGQASSKAD